MKFRVQAQVKGPEEGDRDGLGESRKLLERRDVDDVIEARQEKSREQDGLEAQAVDDEEGREGRRQDHSERPLGAELLPGGEGVELPQGAQNEDLEQEEEDDIGGVLDDREDAREQDEGREGSFSKFHGGWRCGVRSQWGRTSPNLLSLV